MGQMNVRIDDTLKKRGDRVFEAHGLTPSAVVRKIWQYAAETKELPEFLESDIILDPEAEREQRRALAESGAGMATKMIGVEPLLSAEALPYEELREEAYLERLLDGKN